MPVLSLVTHLLGFALLTSAIPLSPLADSIHPDNMVRQAMASHASPATLSLARRFNSTGSSNVLRFDQARARSYRQRARSHRGSTSEEAGVLNVPADNQVVSYVTTVFVGDSCQPFNLLVDTGSSNTWVGADSMNMYIPSTSSRPTGELFQVTYGSGKVTGVEYTETITLAEGLTLYNQSIGVAEMAEGFEGVDGILGIGPSGLTSGSFIPDTEKSVYTVIDTAWYQGLLNKYMIGISFRPSDKIDNKNGELTFGGVDKTKFKGRLRYTPITTTDPASAFVGVDQSIFYGGRSRPVLKKTSGILDTGTTLILIASDAFERYQNYTGGVPDEDVGLLRITLEQYANLESLYFNIGGAEYELTPNAQIWPRALNGAIGGGADAIYLIVNDFGSASGIGLDFINGMSFLERFYMVYDVGGGRAGLAETEWTYAEIN